MTHQTFHQFERVEVKNGRFKGCKGEISALEPFEAEVFLTVVLGNGSKKTQTSMIKYADLTSIDERR